MDLGRRPMHRSLDRGPTTGIAAYAPVIAHLMQQKGVFHSKVYQSVLCKPPSVTAKYYI